MKKEEVPAVWQEIRVPMAPPLRHCHIHWRGLAAVLEPQERAIRHSGEQNGAGLVPGAAGADDSPAENLGQAAIQSGAPEPFACEVADRLTVRRPERQ